jgi:hypothetical protein
LVSANPSIPEVRIASRKAGRSSQPQRRGRPVTEPNSLPPLAQQIAGRVAAARSGTDRPRPASRSPFAIPSTVSIAVGPMPSPAHAPPAVADDVTYGIRPVVDVEQAALRAPNIDVVQAADRSLGSPSFEAHRDVGTQALREREVVGRDLGRVG